MYYIWKRNDGHINATTYAPQGWRDPSNGEIVSFEILGTLKDWDNKEAAKITEKGKEK